jgi:4-hydroxy-2-oxoheptanedioate aldolase
MVMDPVRKALAENGAAFGSWVALGDPLCAEAIGRIGYDFVILDAQHGGINFDNMLGVLQALDLGATRALVRVPWLDQAQIMRAMDLGALGVVVPMVSTPAQAREAAEAIRYPPNGARSFGLVRNYYGVQPMAFDPLCFVMLETAEGLENVDAIAATPGVDGLFIGPADLGISLGHGLVLEPKAEVFAAIDRIVEACRRHGKICGAAAMGMAYARLLLEHGVQFVAQGHELSFVRAGAAAELSQLQAWRKELAGGRPAG